MDKSKQQSRYGRIGQYLAKLFHRPQIERIVLTSTVVSKICDLSRDAAPKEFLAFLEGSIVKGELIITDIVYQMYIANEYAALPRMDLPLLNNVVGTVHSHPSGSTRPSHADRQFFAHQGVVHYIIGRPFSSRTLHCYDKEGHELQYTIR